MIAAYRRHAPLLLVLSAFGPVLGGGLRLEHVAAFGLALLGLFLGGGRRPPVALVLTGLAWLALAAIAVSDTLRASASHLLPMQNSLGPPKDVDPIGFRTILSGLAQLLLPLAAAVVALRSGEGRTALRTLVVLTALNTFVAVAQFAMPEAALPLLRLFWPGGDEGTALLSMGNGRFGGIFNHPAEAAMATTLAIFVLPVAWPGPFPQSTIHNPQSTRDWAVGLLLPLLVLGGVLSFSKTVLFLGFPLAAVYLVVEHRQRPVFTPRSSLLLGGWTVVALAGIFSTMHRLGFGFDSLTGLNVIASSDATGGRFSAEGGTVSWAFGQVAALSPLTGLGFGTFNAYDSMYLVAFAYAGAVGLLVYLGALAALAFRVPKVRHRTTLAFTLLFVALAGIGIPTFTSVRVGVLLTLFVVGLAVPTERSLRT